MCKSVLAATFLSAGVATATASAPAQASFNPLTQAYQEQSEPGSACQFQGDCAVVFDALPSKTIVTHVSCNFFLASGGVVLNSYLIGQSSNPANNLQPFAYAASPSGTQYGINADTYVVFTKGQEPRVDVFSDGQPVQFLNCTISGFHN